MKTAGPRVMGIRLFGQPLDRLAKLAAQAAPGYGIFADTHVIMQAHDDGGFRRVVESASWVTADGAPVWVAGRLTGRLDRISGPDAVPAILAACAHERTPVGFLGMDADRLERLRQRVATTWPTLDVRLLWDPGVGTADQLASQANLQRIRASGAKVVFVGLGCPKQERFMASAAQATGTLMLGVGQALDILAGAVPRAPKGWRRLGLEWLYRLAREPRRLWRRYLLVNARFPIALLTWRRRAAAK